MSVRIYGRLATIPPCLRCVSNQPFSKLFACNRQDVEWLGLQEGVDFGCMIDLAGLTRVYNEQYGAFFQLDDLEYTVLCMARCLRFIHEVPLRAEQAHLQALVWTTSSHAGLGTSTLFVKTRHTTRWATPSSRYRCIASTLNYMPIHHRWHDSRLRCWRKWLRSCCPCGVSGTKTIADQHCESRRLQESFDCLHERTLTTHLW